MNPEKLFKIQAELVDHIEENHPRQDGEDRLEKKILALQVELGELANELPEVFKFWSNKKNNYEKALVELVDVLHFILDIGLELSMDKINLYIARVQMDDDVVTLFNEIFSDASELRFKALYSAEKRLAYESFFNTFVSLGKALGFTWEQIEGAYLAKNKINHERQESGY